MSMPPPHAPTRIVCYCYYTFIGWCCAATKCAVFSHILITLPYQHPVNYLKNIQQENKKIELGTFHVDEQNVSKKKYILARGKKITHKTCRQVFIQEQCAIKYQHFHDADHHIIHIENCAIYITSYKGNIFKVSPKGWINFNFIPKYYILLYTTRKQNQPKKALYHIYVKGVLN